MRSRSFGHGPSGSIVTSPMGSSIDPATMIPRFAWRYSTVQKMLWRSLGIVPSQKIPNS